MTPNGEGCAQCSVVDDESPAFTERFDFEEDTLVYNDAPLAGFVWCKACRRRFAFKCAAMLPGYLWDWTLVPVEFVGSPQAPEHWWLSVVEDRRGGTRRERAVRIAHSVARPELSSFHESPMQRARAAMTRPVLTVPALSHAKLCTVVMQSRDGYAARPRMSGCPCQLQLVDPGDQLAKGDRGDIRMYAIGSATLSHSEEEPVVIGFLDPETWTPRLTVGAEFVLFEGNKVIGRGLVNAECWPRTSA